MVASIYSEILQYEEVGGDYVKRLQAMNVAHVFSPLILAYYLDNDAYRFNKVLLYLLHTYSFKSKFHVLGSDWRETKKNIARHVGIDENEVAEPPAATMYNEVVLLESQPFVLSVQNYLDYQGERSFKHLIMLKDLYAQMVSSALDRIMKASGTEVDYDQKYKNHDYATNLLKEINEWEQRVAEGNRELKEAMSEIQESSAARVKKSLRLEDNLIKYI